MIRERLPEFAEGALGGRDFARVEQHVTSCARCQKEVADLRVVIKAVRAVPADEAPDTLAPRIRRAVQQRAPVRGRRLLWPRLAIPVAVLTGLIAVSFALRGPQQQFARGGGPVLAPAASELAQKAAERGGVGGGAGAIAPEAEQLARANAPPEQPQLPRSSEPSATSEQAQIAAEPVAPQPSPMAKAAPEDGQAAGAVGQSDAADQMRMADKAEAPQAPTRQFAEPPARQAGKALGGTEGGARGGGAWRSYPPLHGPVGRVRGGRAGGGGPRSGRAATRPGRDLSVPEDAGRGGTYGGHKERDQLRPLVEERADALAAASAAKPKTAASLAPVFARASLVKGAGQTMIALEVASAATTDTITLRLGGGPPQTYEWRGSGTRPATIPLLLDKIAGPAVVPIEVTSSAGKRDYVLFVPVMSRLGQVAPSAPVAEYKGTPLQSVLADLSKMTGLVILAEQPLDAQVKGGIPKGTPEASLRKLGEANGFDVEGQGDLVFTLTHRR
jgi:hypothetical protein